MALPPERGETIRLLTLKAARRGTNSTSGNPTWTIDFFGGERSARTRLDADVNLRINNNEYWGAPVLVRFDHEGYVYDLEATQP